MRHSKRRPDSTSERLKLGMCLNHIGQPKAIQCSGPFVRQNAPTLRIPTRLIPAFFSMRCRAATKPGAILGKVDKARGLKD
jgi:hypothetical protein